MEKNYKLKLILSLCLGLILSNNWAQVTTFSYTGAMQTYVVPTGVTTVHMELYGASGYGNLGLGGSVEGVFTVVPGETLNIFVGGSGGTNTGGFNGGGTPGSLSNYGGGGGASDVRQGGADFADRIVVAGAGGGSGSNCGLWTAEGGHGGNLIGQSGCDYSCSDCQYTGTGGTQLVGGTAGPTGHGSCGGNNNGEFGAGGSNTGSYGTGGGGGYYGGGSGCFEGAGGGSSYTNPSATEVIHAQGVRDGNGEIIITVLCSGLITTIPVTGVCIDEELTLYAESVTGGDISWSGPAAVDNGVPFEPTLGTFVYTATSTSPEDCNFEIEISASEIPTIVANSSHEAACEGAFITVNGEGGDTYTWTGDGDVDPLDGVPFEGEAGVVTYTVIGSVLGCEGEPASIEVEGAPQPSVVGTATPATLCLGDSYIVSASGEGVTDSYWGGGIENGDEITPEAAGTYIHTVIGLSDVGCGDTTTITVIVNEVPFVEAGLDIVQCVEMEVTLNGSGASTYTWDPAITDGEAFVVSEGETTYTVTSTDANGCSDTDEIIVTGVGVPVITADITHEFSAFTGEIDLTVTGGTGPYGYT